MSPRFFQSKARQQSPLHFLHVGKTGGTAIRHALKNNLETGHFRLIMHNHPTTLADVPLGEGVVFFLRDPVSRYVSGFWSRFRKGQPRYNVPWSAKEKTAFTRFETPSDLALALSSNDPVEQSAARDAMNGINHVRFRYVDWLVSPTELERRNADLVFIGFQESLKGDFQILKQKIGVPDKLSLPVESHAAHRTPNNLNKAICERASANLREWYAEDYALLEYCKSRAAEINARNIA